MNGRPLFLVTDCPAENLPASRTTFRDARGLGSIRKNTVVRIDYPSTWIASE